MAQAPHPLQPMAHPAYAAPPIQQPPSMQAVSQPLFQSFTAAPSPASSERKFTHLKMALDYLLIPHTKLYYCLSTGSLWSSWC